MESSIIQRIKSYLSNIGVSNRSLALRMGVSEKTLNNKLNGTRGLDMDTLQKIALQFEELNINWLITGAGTMFKDAPHGDSCTDLEKYGVQVKPHFDSRIACGPAGFEMMLKNEDSSPRGLPIISDYDFSVVAGGNSMINRNNPQLSIAPGDIMAFKISSGKFIEWGEVYAVATPDGMIAKKIAPSEKDNAIKCISFNEEEGFSPFELDTTDIYGLAKLVGVVRVSMLANH